MFVKKLVEKASLKKPGGNVDGLKPDDVDPRLIFHHGIPSGSILFASDSIQKILAVSTRDGRVKLFGRNNTQALLESPETVPSKFLQFMENQGFLLNVYANGHIEVWDLDRNLLSHVHSFKKEITSFTVLEHTPYMFVGDSLGNVSVLKLQQEPCNVVCMQYHIPYSASHCNVTEDSADKAVVHILPQPGAESKRVLIIYRDGFITLWLIQESKAIFTIGGSILQSHCHEIKKVTAACWVCPFGSKVVVGYNNGEIFVWSIPSTLTLKSELAIDKCTTQGVPICKLNLGYKLEKIPIAKLKWAHGDGKSSRLYVLGASETVSANLVQVVLMNEHIESRTVKLGLHPLEPYTDMVICPSFSEESKHKQDNFLLLGKSGRIYAYDDFSIEKYLLQCQSRSPPSLPTEVMMKLPFAGSSISVARYITGKPCGSWSADEDYSLMVKDIPAFFPSEMWQKDGIHSNSTQFCGLSKIRNLYITGHSNGTVNFWDASCVLLRPAASVIQQSEDDLSPSGIPLTALYFSSNSWLLITGDQSGMVRIFKFKPEPFTMGNSFMSLQGSSKKGSNLFIQKIKVLKVDGVVLSINTSPNLKYVAVGCDQGYISVIDAEKATILYQKYIASELCKGIIFVQFESCSFHGFEKNVLVVATRDSSILALESDTGDAMSSSMVHPKKPSRALFMQILDGHERSSTENDVQDNHHLMNGKATDDVTSKSSLLLLCSEKAAYVYSFMHVVEGKKKVLYKKKFNSSCCWASTFYSPFDAGLLLLFASGKIEIRSLPDLSLLKETSLRGLTCSISKQNLMSDSSVCNSRSGELILVNHDQEAFVLSVMLQREVYRHMGAVCQVYNKDFVVSQGLASEPVSLKDKKKGIFGSAIKDTKGSKAKLGSGVVVTDLQESIEDLSRIFSVPNFPLDAESTENHTVDEDDVKLDLDDIDIDDLGEKPKANPMMVAVNKQMLTSKFKAITGRLKHTKVKNEKDLVREEPPQEEKAGTVDQIKKKYGYSTSGESSGAKLAANKLNENLKKLQGINIKTTAMQNTAQSFSSMAKEFLSAVQRDNRGS